MRVSPPGEPSSGDAAHSRGVRSFVAIALADPARAAVVAYLDGLRGLRADVAWTRAENLHLTLKFLGTVAETRLVPLAERLRALAAATAPFALRVAGVGAFPNLARPRALWVGVEAPAVAALADGVERACAAEGFPADDRPFRPHVTLGRVRDRRGGGARDGGHASFAFLADDGRRDFGGAPVDALVLFRSELRPGGSRHTPITVLPFGLPAR